jgi:putative intracellular protease/amidase
MNPTQILIYDGFDELDAVAPYEILSVAGVTSAIDLALFLVEAEKGPEAAAAEVLRLEYEGRGAA